MVDLSTTIGGNITLHNPIMTASGTFGYGPEYEEFVDFSKLGGIIVKGTTLEPRDGNYYPRMVETPSGMLNAVGLQNKGIDYFIDYIYPSIKHYDCEIIVNVSGAKTEDYVAVIEKLIDLDKIRVVEINISCPNVKKGGMGFGTTCEGASSITKEIRKKWPRTMMVKLTPNVTDIVSIARAVEDEGADSVSLINTLLGMAINVEKRKPYLSTITGGLSGPAIRPVAVRMVWQVAKMVKIPVVGLGGIMNGRDALEFIMAGASAVQIGTANFINPSVTKDIYEYLNSFCQSQGIRELREIIGCINQ